MAATDRNLFQRVWDEVKYLAKIATKGSKESRQLEKIKKTFSEAYRDIKNTAQKVDGEKFSLCQFEDGTRFVEIDQDQDRFDGHSVDEYPRIAKDIINEKFNHKVIGTDNKMYVNSSGRDEFANPSKRISDDLYQAKMRTAGELDNLLDAGTNFRNKPDGEDGHIHPDVVDGFDYFDTIFKIGSRYFKAVINIKNVAKGKLFKDVTKIEDVTQDIMSSYGNNPKSQFLRTSSIYSLSENDSNVNSKMSLSEDAGGTVAAGSNVYGADVAWEPVKQDVQVDDNSNTETNLPADSSAEVDTAQLERIPGSKIAFLENGVYNNAINTKILGVWRFMRKFWIICILGSLLLTGCVSAPAEVTEPTEISTQPAVTEPTESATEPATEPPTEPPTEPVETEPIPEPADEDFVKIIDYIPDVVIDMRYSTQNNHTGKVIYEFEDMWLRYGTVKKLMKVQELLKQDGYRLKIWDGFRPTFAQYRLWEACPDARYVANPYVEYSNHSRGNTVDITIVYADGNEVLMPTEFDDTTPMADRDYSDCSPYVAQNSQYLEDIMKSCGFWGYWGEWWHYTDNQKYPVEEEFNPADGN